MTGELFRFGLSEKECGLDKEREREREREREGVERVSKRVSEKEVLCEREFACWSQCDQ